MGCERFYPEEAPVREVSVEDFWIDPHPVTVAELRVPRADDYPDADPELLVTGSLVFRKTAGPVPLDDYRNWWTWMPGADWRHPEGPGSTVGGRERHPVTHVAYADALAYAERAGKSLPTEAEWEYAARGGLDGAVFTWGDEFAPKGRMMANTWQGEFPWQNLLLDRYEGTSPVETYPPNGYGLYDMAGNIWEWTEDVFAHRAANGAGGCCAPRDPRAASDERFLRRVIKGGSHLCAPTNYCLRYRPAARQGEAIDSTTGHIGFRCVLRSSAG